MSHHVARGNLKAAEIELRNAIRDAPQAPVLRARLAEVYMRLGDAASAEREARAARERGATRPVSCRFWQTPCSRSKNSPILLSGRTPCA
jgi:predicted Zn-dependent protease